jgi:hypothetical protein
MSTIFDAVTSWWHNWKTTRANLASLDRCGTDDTGRIAQDLGVTASELRALAGKWPESAGLLNCRLAALGLDPAEIRRTDPQVLSDLRRVCTMCSSGRRCKRDLSRHGDDPVWREYCPNVVTLDALAADQATSVRRAEMP